VKPVLVRQHEEMTPPGLLVEWLEDRGISYEVHYSYKDESIPDPSDTASASLVNEQRAEPTRAFCFRTDGLACWRENQPGPHRVHLPRRMEPVVCDQG